MEAHQNNLYQKEILKKSFHLFKLSFFQLKKIIKKSNLQKFG